MNDEKRAELTTPGDREIHIERILDAPRDRVFAAFTNPELIPQWWGPRRIKTEVKKMDVRPGGDWHFICHDPDQGGMQETYQRLDELLAAGVA